MITTFRKSSATILRAGTRDDHGEVVADWTTPDEIEISTCVVQPALSAEQLVNRDAVEQHWTIWAPDNTDLRATDRVRFAGRTYEVVGAPFVWAGPASLSHLQADLVVWEG